MIGGDGVNKNKRFARRFINHLFGVYNVPRIPIHIHYGYPSLSDPAGNFCFATYVYEDGKLGCIHAAGDVGTTTLMSILAHEFVHYVQRIKGRDMNDIEAIERDAEYWSAGLMGQYIINKKRNGDHCYGVADIWKEKPKEADK